MDEKIKKQRAKLLTKCEDMLLFMSIHSIVTDSEKERIRKRMDKFWKKTLEEKKDG